MPEQLNIFLWQNILHFQLQYLSIRNYLFDKIEDFIADSSKSQDIKKAAQKAKDKIKIYYPSSNGLVYTIATGKYIYYYI